MEREQGRRSRNTTRKQRSNNTKNAHEKERKLFIIKYMYDTHEVPLPLSFNDNTLQLGRTRDADVV